MFEMLIRACIGTPITDDDSDHVFNELNKQFELFKKQDETSKDTTHDSTAIIDYFKQQYSKLKQEARYWFFSSIQMSALIKENQVLLNLVETLTSAQMNEIVDPQLNLTQQRITRWTVLLFGSALAIPLGLSALERLDQPLINVVIHHITQFTQAPLWSLDTALMTLALMLIPCLPYILRNAQKIDHLHAIKDMYSHSGKLVISDQTLNIDSKNLEASSNSQFASPNQARRSNEIKDQLRPSDSNQKNLIE
tara:strand:- start:524 stop:1276 length:753 start_codon:yes stop_codon:yes gene_type:complete